MRRFVLLLLAGLLLPAFGQTSKFDAGLALYREGRFREAVQEFIVSERSGEDQPLREFYHGVCLAKLGDWTATSERLLAYISAQPADPHGWYWLSRTQLLQKRFADARAAAQRAISLDPKSYESYRTLGELELELHNNDAAYRAWIAANKLNPGDAQTAYYLGRLFFEAEFFDEAAVWLREALRLAPTHFSAMTYLGLCAEHLGDKQTAARLYQQAIQHSKLRKTPYAWLISAMRNSCANSGTTARRYPSLKNRKNSAQMRTRSLFWAKCSPTGRTLLVPKRCFARRSKWTSVSRKLTIV